MPTSLNSLPRKRPVNLTLSEDLVRDARQFTRNLSGVVEELLSEFVKRERGHQREEINRSAATVTLWNAFGEQHGAYSDDHSTL